MEKATQGTKHRKVAEQQISRFEAYKQKQLSNPEIRRAYNEGMELLRLGVSIAALREKLGFTQTQLAALLYTSPSVISRVEHGQNVELKTLYRIAHALKAELKFELVQNQVA